MSATIALRDVDETDTDSAPGVMQQRVKAPLTMSIFLIVAGLIGLWAAFALMVDKIELLQNPSTSLGCNFSVLVQCGKNLGSWQGSVLGFPNPILGLGGWTATIAVGVGTLAGGRYTRWFWLLFNLGVVGAAVLVTFLITQSIYSLGTLCPWCMVTWFVTIPTFWTVTFFNFKSGNIPVPERARKIFHTLFVWAPAFALGTDIVIAILAQVRLEWIQNIFFGTVA